MNSLGYTLATAGHIDHGKSALVRALTGIEPDRLPEEKARGLTIELGFAHFALAAVFPVGGPEQTTLDVGIIDVPGHEDFVKNMVAGVGSIDAALLVVAADDRWMPQTEEHLRILMHLGVLRGVVALTKSDLVDDVAGVIAELRERVRGTFLESSAIVPTSVITREGIGKLKSALAEMLVAAPPQRDMGKPRLAVDRAFSLKGVGTVVTGTLSGGMLKTGQRVVAQPGGADAHVRTIHTHGKPVDAGTPGARVALNLPELSVAADRASRLAGNVARGDVITITSLGRPTSLVDVCLEQLARDEPRTLRTGANVWLHHGSGAISARLRLLSSGPGPILARLKLASPIFALVGDRFVLRDWSERHTLTGGIMLDVDPKPIRRDGRQVSLLQMRAANPSIVSSFANSQLVRDRVLERSSLLVRSRFSANEVEGAIAQLIRHGTAVDHGGTLFHAAAFTELKSAAVSAIDAYHRAHPERPGLPMTDLHRLLHRPGIPASAANSTIAALCEDGLVRRGPAIARANHRPALPARLAAAGERLRLTLQERPFDPPSRNQLVRDDAAQGALKFLIAAGQAVEIGPDVVFSAEAYARAVEMVRSHLRRHGPATVSQLKTLLSSSRRVTVPLVEKLDRDGITRRQGDLRVLREG